MTSQKRYRHHQDGGKNRDRFKDIPPRFKRQKSSSSPTRDLSQSNDERDSKTTHTHEAVSPEIDLALPPSPATREPISSGIYQIKEKAAVQLEAGTDKMQTPQLPSRSTWEYPQELNSIYVASHWDYQGYMNGSFQQPTHVALGTHFGYKTNPPPPYPWSPVDASHLYGLPDVTEDPVWTNSYAVQRIHHSSDYTSNNENLASGQYTHQFKPQDGCWDSPPSVHYPASTSPPVKNGTSPLPTESGEKIINNRQTDLSTNKQMVDYSDPDIRTIEMLRELERVADQKERENEDFGADRKSLVSHHLRMLMCAVDRYTEGIEDDLAMISRHDEVRPASDSRGSTPGVSAEAVNKTGDVTRNKIEQNLNLQSPRKPEQSIWNETSSSSKTSNKLSNETQDSYALSNQGQELYILLNQPQEPHVPSSQTQETYTLSNQTQEPYVIQNQPPDLYVLPNQPQKAYVLSPHTPPFMSEHNFLDSKNNTAWDLWSSPTFDFCNVLTSHASDISSLRSTQDRRPLYQRQLQSFE